MSFPTTASVPGPHQVTTHEYQAMLSSSPVNFSRGSIVLWRDFVPADKQGQSTAPTHRVTLKERRWEQAPLAPGRPQKQNLSLVQEVIKGCMSGVDMLVSSLQSTGILNVFGNKFGGQVDYRQLLIKHTHHAWRLSPVRALAWHPSLPILAIARFDDTIDVRQDGKEPVVLSLTQQSHGGTSLLKDISDIQWCPTLPGLLAVAYRGGIALWELKADLRASVRILAGDGVSSLSWSPDGSFLAAASPVAKNIVIWDVMRSVSTEILRGVLSPMLRWSPDGTRLLSTTAGPTFRIWDTRDWTCEIWETGAGKVTTATWGSAGRILLFACNRSTNVNSLQFVSDKEPRLAVVFDTVTTTTNNDYKIGGDIDQIAWDDKGNRVAISFAPTFVIELSFSYKSDGDKWDAPHTEALHRSLTAFCDLLPEHVVDGAVQPNLGGVPKSMYLLFSSFEHARVVHDKFRHDLYRIPAILPSLSLDSFSQPTEDDGSLSGNASPLVASFRVHPSFDIHPVLHCSGFIRGPEGAFASAIAFMPKASTFNSPDVGAVLTTCWLDKTTRCEIKFLPMYFKS